MSWERKAYRLSQSVLSMLLRRGSLTRFVVHLHILEDEIRLDLKMVRPKLGRTQ